MSERVTFGVAIGGVAHSESVTRDGSVFTDNVTLAAGKDGTLTTRTDDDTGVVTVGANHGITNTDVVDVGWVDADGYNQHRARMAVNTVDTNTVTLDGGTGTNFPAVNSTVVVGVRDVLTFSMDGDSLKLLSLFSDPPTGTASRAMVDFVDSGGNTLHAFDLANNEPFVWADNSPIVNPLAGDDVAAIELSSLTNAAPTVYVEIVYDAGL